MSNDIAHMHELRVFELDCVLEIMRRQCVRQGSSILEIGAGTGFQAQRLAREGYQVTAVDLPTSNFAEKRVWSVNDYDGKNLPFEDCSFDVVFSSNVLEHVTHLSDLQAEMLRVLKDDGVTIHVIPSVWWRSWSSLSHYAYLAKRGWLVFFGIMRGGLSSGKEELQRSFVVRRPLPQRIGRVIFPGRHGERGNFITEMFYFSRAWWRRSFHAAGWRLVSASPTGLFYTGYEVFGPRISVDARRCMAKVLGSAATIFVVKKMAPSARQTKKS